MSVESTYASIQVLEGKVKLLLERYKQQKKLIQQLQKENKQLQKQLLKTTKPTFDFSDRLKVGTITEADQEGGSGTINERIEGFIKDIDRCIAYLNSL